jgi:hypothetical protein
MDFSSRQKYAKMTRALAELRRIYTSTGNSITTSQAMDAFETFVNHAYQLKDYIKEEFPGKARATETYITNNRHLSLLADVQNSLKHAADVRKRRSDHEKETGAPPLGDLIRMNTHTRVDMNPVNCSQRYVLTFDNKEVDSLDLAMETVAAWNDFLKSEGIDTIKQ